MRAVKGLYSLSHTSSNMKTNEVEKILKRKFQHGKSLKEQTSPAEWAEICFKSALETEIITQKSMVNRTETDEEIEARVAMEFQKMLDESNGDYEAAVNLLP